MIDEYLVLLNNELLLYEKYYNIIKTIFIGGGTPLILDETQLSFLLGNLKKINFDEFTIEVNPAYYTEEKGVLLKDYGVNRISIKVETFNDNLLKILNEDYRCKDICNTYDSLRSLGFDNINIDLTYGIPNQTIEMLKEDLNLVSKLDLNHVSYNGFILEDNTYFHKMYLTDKLELTSNDLEADMFELVIKTLRNQGYEHYEITNFTKDNKQSKHNMLYWTLKDYIGIGIGAHGLFKGYRTNNNLTMSSYKENYINKVFKQSRDNLLQDELIFGLRVLKGINISYIEKKYDIILLKKYPELINKINLGLLKVSKGYLKLTYKGLFLANNVFEVFI